ncbi:MAG: transglutaminase domain-containing protein, partial [Thermoanaerobaculales bacterium]|nr:transglutaminase domain-containing protein [Thermoanaerobaculales bacterium]
MTRTILLLLVGVLSAACSPSPHGTDKTTPRADIAVVSLVTELEDFSAELRVHGPVGHLDFTLDGGSIFEPVRIPNDATTTERAHTIFEFVSKNLPSWNVNRRISTSGLLFGAGYGMCIDQARVLVALWHRHGIEGRLVTSADHSAAEALIEGRWHFFDPQHHLDHSEVFGSPTSIFDIQTSTPPWPFRFDRYGYRVDWLQRTYSGMAPQEKVEGWLEIQRPTLALAERESLVIRPRSTISETVLPLSPVPRSSLRAGLINTYELQLRHVFAEGTEVVCFEPDLP